MLEADELISRLLLLLLSTIEEAEVLATDIKLKKLIKVVPYQAVTGGGGLLRHVEDDD